MKIVVLHGSPKGEQSVTMQYVRYLEKKLTSHTWSEVQTASRISKLEQDADEFARVIGLVRDADIVLWSFPLYHLLVPSQMKRFIELVAERGVQDSFFGKYSAAIMTSIHYYDHTARNYIHAVSEDLGMRFSGAFTPAMDDLKNEQTQKNLVAFMNRAIDERSRGLALPVSFPALNARSFEYRPGAAAAKCDAAGLRVRVLYDGASGGNAKAMAERFASRFESAELLDLSALDIRGGCLGCMKCGAKNICVYDGSDGFRPAFERMVLDADIVVFAGTIRDRYLSASFKRFFDRSFFLNHKGAYEKKQICWLVSGPLGQIPNLRQIMEGYADVSRGNLAGAVSDESGDSAFIDAQIDALAERAAEFSRCGYIAPSTFLGEGGRRIFRDEIWAGMRIIFAEDYRYYRKTGRFDFPQKKIVNRTAVPLAGLLFRIPALRRMLDREMKRGMILPLQKVVEKA